MRRHTFLFVFVLGLVAACGETPPPPAKKAPPAPPPPTGIDVGRSDIAAAARAVRKSCSLSQLGDVSACVGDVVAELERVEKQAGAMDALWSYCQSIDDKDLGIKVLAANRTGQLAGHAVLAERPNDQLLACYLEKIPRVRNVYLAQLYVRAASFLATAMKQEEKLFAALDRMPAPPDLQRAAIEALWPNGRRRVIPRLKKALESKDPTLRKAVVLGFGYVKSLEPDERGEVCGLLGPLLGEEVADLAVAAAQRVAMLCPEQRKDVLTQARAALTKKTLGLGLVEALQSIAASAADKERKAAVGLLAATGSNRSLPEITRRAALRSLTGFDSALAARLEKRLNAEPKPKPRPAPPPPKNRDGRDLTVLPAKRPPPAKK